MLVVIYQLGPDGASSTHEITGREDESQTRGFFESVTVEMHVGVGFSRWFRDERAILTPPQLSGREMSTGNRRIVKRLFDEGMDILEVDGIDAHSW